MASADISLGPKEVVQHYWFTLNEREFQDAYWLLTSVDREAVPLSEWLGPSWNSIDDGLGDNVEYVEWGDVNEVEPRQARVAVTVGYRNGLKADFNYTTILEPQGWRVYLGLERGGREF